MTSDSCNIILDNYNGHYMSGCIIKGRVECAVTQPRTELNSTILNIPTGLELNISLVRKENVKIHNARYSQDSVIGVYQAAIYDSNTSLNRSESRVIAFQYYIPKYIASSFETNFGTVSYVLKLKIEGDGTRLIPTKEIPIKIISLYYENNYPREYLNPDHFWKEKYISCCPLHSISMKLIIPKRVFIPGEVLPFAVLVKTSFSAFNTSLCLKLVKVVTYKGTPNIRNRRKIQGTILEINKPVQRIEDSQYKYKLSVNIPEDIEIINFNGCKLFEVQYKLIVKGKVNGRTLFFKIRIYLACTHTATASGSNNEDNSSPDDIDEESAPNLATIISRPNNIVTPSRATAPPLALDERDGEEEEDDDVEVITRSPRYPESPPPSYDDVMRTVPSKGRKSQK